MTTPVGLNAAEVRDRRGRGLVNLMPDDGGRSFARILATNAFTVFNGVVGGAFVLLLVLGSWQDALFGFFVIANTVIGVAQEFRAKRTLARLALLNAPRAVVLRDGVEIECAAEDVVLSDVLVLRPGEQLIADAAILEAHELEVDESLITGEAEPASRKAGHELFSGSIVVAGSGLARVIRVGANSYAARITSEARQFSLVNSELRRSISRIVRWLSVGLVPIGALIVNGQMQAVGGWSVAISNGSWREASITSVASIVATVPAGLVFMTSVALALGAVRLGRSRVLVRELAAVEGLARVDVLCIDKTGTLTEGSVTLDHVDPVDHPAAGWQSALAWLATDPSANATARALAVEFSRARAEGADPDAVVAFSSRHKWSAVHFTTGVSAGTWVLGGADVIFADRVRESTSPGRTEDGHLPARGPSYSPIRVARFLAAWQRVRGCPTDSHRSRWSSFETAFDPMRARSCATSHNRTSRCTSCRETTRARWLRSGAKWASPSPSPASTPASFPPNPIDSPRCSARNESSVASHPNRRRRSSSPSSPSGTPWQ